MPTICPTRRREKAGRGELIVNTPVGYIKSDEGLLQKDPDLRVQESLHLIFKKALQLGTARQVLMWLIEHGLQVPTKRYRAKSWETIWRRPSCQMVHGILRNPIYAGTYAYGKTEVKVEFTDGKMQKKVKRKPLQQRTTLIYDHHESYVDRDGDNVWSVDSYAGINVASECQCSGKPCLWADPIEMQSPGP